MAPWRACPTLVATGAPGHCWSIRSRPSLRPTSGASTHFSRRVGGGRTRGGGSRHLSPKPTRGMAGCTLSVTAGGGDTHAAGQGHAEVYTVETDPKGGCRGEAKGSTRAVAKGDNKAEVVKRTIEVAKKQPKAQVRIKGRNGRIQKERTYPRSSDPRRTPS